MSGKPKKSTKEVPKKPPKKSNAGRPTKYDPTLNKKVTAYLLMGASLAETADFLGIHRANMDLWRKRYPEFHDAIEEGLHGGDANVTGKLYKRASGMRVKKEKVIYDKDVAAMVISQAAATARAAANELGLSELEVEQAVSTAVSEVMKTNPGVMKVTYYEDIPGDVKAQIFYLTNRRGKAWKAEGAVEGPTSGEAAHAIEWQPAEGCQPLANIEDIEAEGAKLNDPDYAGN